MPEMVPLGSLMTKQEFMQMQLIMSRPRWDASKPAQATGMASTIDAQAQVKENAVRYVAHQRALGEAVYTGSASQPVGGRMQRNHKLNSSREEWGEEEEAAFQKAFGKQSQR